MSDERYQIESMVCGAMMQEPWRTKSTTVTMEDFSIPLWRELYATVVQLATETNASDVGLVIDRFAKRTGRNDAHKIVANAYRDAVAANADLYAAKMLDMRRIRESRAILQTAIDNLGRDDSAIDTAIRELMALSRPTSGKSIDLKDALGQAVEEIEKVMAAKGGLMGVRSGWRGLDSMTGGFRGGDFYVVGGRPAMGKTAWMLNAIESAQVPLGVISAEMPAMQLAMRLMAVRGQISSQRVRCGELNDAEWGMLAATISDLSTRGIKINESAAPKISDVVRQAREWKHRDGIKALFVDYLQRLKGSKEKRHEEVAEIAMTLKELARELDIPVIALAQVSREVDKKPNPRPGMGDLKDSGTIEQEADMIVLLYRDEVYHPESQDAGTAEFLVDKNRHGPTGMIRTYWIADQMRFVDFAHERA